MAHGREPSPPASETATESSASDEPAIGAWMIGSSMPAKVVKVLSNPMKDRLNHKDTKAQRHKGITRQSRNQIEMSLRQRCSPPGTGGVDAPSIKCREASFERRGRGGQFGETFRVSDHPVCAASERDLFLNGAATPPVPGGEYPSPVDLREPS